MQDFTNKVHRGKGNVLVWVRTADLIDSWLKATGAKLAHNLHVKFATTAEQATRGLLSFATQIETVQRHLKVCSLTGERYLLVVRRMPSTFKVFSLTEEEASIRYLSDARQAEYLRTYDPSYTFVHRAEVGGPDKTIDPTFFRAVVGLPFADPRAVLRSANIANPSLTVHRFGPKLYRQTERLPLEETLRLTSSVHTTFTAAHDSTPCQSFLAYEAPHPTYWPPLQRPKLE
jgi:hypothetical protein